MSITLEQVNNAYDRYLNEKSSFIKQDLYKYYIQKLDEYYSTPVKNQSYSQSYQDNNAYGLYTTGTGSINIGSTESFIGCHGNYLGIR